MLDLYKLRIFAIVAQEGSFSAAAERLFISQSAVSQHMKELEAVLGRSLFVRGRRGVKLTAHGEVLKQYAGEILALVARAETALTDVAHLPEGKVSIGVTPGVAVYLAPDWIQSFRDRYPRLTVALQTDVTGRIVAGVLSGRLDMGFIEGELEGYLNPRLAWRDLEEVEQLVVVGRDHPWAGLSSVALEDLNEQPLIMRQPESQTRAWLDGVLRHHRVRPVVATEFDNLESIKRSTAQGICLTILPEYVVSAEVAARQLVTIPIAGRPLRRTLKLVWAADSHFSPVATAFLTVLGQRYSVIREFQATK
jgi:LysR family transcriptional regulator, low CO2-responsive transcriptional regulator